MGRIERFLDELKDMRLDGFLFTFNIDIHYLVGFSGSAGMLWVSPERRVFMTDFRYKTQSEAQVGDKAEIHIISHQKDYLTLIEELELFKGARFVGIDANNVSVAQHKRLVVKFPDVNFIGIENPLKKLRQVKDDGELEKIRRAINIAVEGLKRTIPKLVPGISEKEFAAELEYEMKKLGSERVPFETIVASGYRAAMPHGIASDKTIKKGEMVTVDFGATFEGYASDLTRTYFLGEPDEKFIEVYSTVLRAQNEAIKNMRAGMSGKDIDGIARKVIEDAGYAEFFGHGLGHGIGLVVHDFPRLSPKNEDAIPAGCVVTVEPGIYIPDWGGVRIEDDVWLTGDGAVLLSDKLPRELNDIILHV